MEDTRWRLPNGVLPSLVSDTRGKGIGVSHHHITRASPVDDIHAEVSQDSFLHRTRTFTQVTGYRYDSYRTHGGYLGPPYRVTCVIAPPIKSSHHIIVKLYAEKKRMAAGFITDYVDLRVHKTKWPYFTALFA